MTANTESTTCAIAGGGPAGVFLGLLLARAGVETVVLEKHADFLRDFRGDTVHPSTLQVLDELGLIEGFLRMPHRKVDRLAFTTTDGRSASFTLDGVHPRYPYIAMVPQWDLLNLLTEHARRRPNFRLLMESKVTGLIREVGAVRGLRYRDADGEHELRADLTVAADGRHSLLREAAGLTPIEFGAPMDVLWLRVSRDSEGPEGLQGRLGQGKMAVAIDRGDNWQVAYLVPKGGYEQVRERGIADVRADLRELLPYLGDRIEEFDGWDRGAVLQVAVNRLTRWYRPGLLFIGDAAHAMSPVGGVGINLAVQDAVAAANILTDDLLRAQESGRHRPLPEVLLARVQRRRWTPTVATQTIQRLLQTQIIGRSLNSRTPRLHLLRAVAESPFLRRIPPKMLAVGLLPEHVRTEPARQEPTSA
ncbi:FAD-dependent oxidoreductase [Marinactinospora rubrisoli]|uniref:FAD-dependent oxidoreductase n=1 Tax=Marinactinospora rubrisoli TaxID=2715399 RepID=A0ABW2KJQ8_9ACTN